MCNIYKQQHPFMLGSLKVSHINQLWYHHNSFHKYVHHHHRYHHQNQQIVITISSSKEMQEPESNFYISIIISLNFKLTGFSFHMRSYRPLLCCYFTPYKSITLARPDPVHSPLVPRCVPSPNHNLTSPHLLFLRNPQPGSAKVIGLSKFYSIVRSPAERTAGVDQDPLIIRHRLRWFSQETARRTDA